MQKGRFQNISKYYLNNVIIVQIKIVNVFA